jgi:hypothetical protein
MHQVEQTKNKYTSSFSFPSLQKHHHLRSVKAGDQEDHWQTENEENP